jgi:hypothetical protein
MLRGKQKQRHGVGTYAIAPALEPLEGRQMLAIHSHTLPSGHTSAYIQHASGGDNYVWVRLDSPTGTIDYTFNYDNGMDRIQLPSGTTNFTFVD